MCHRVSGRKGQYQGYCLKLCQGIYGGQPVFHSSGQLILPKCVAAEFLRIGIIRHYRCGKHRDDCTAGAYVSRHAGSGESDPADILCRDDGVCRDKSVFRKPEKRRHPAHTDRSWKPLYVLSFDKLPVVAGQARMTRLEFTPTR